MENLVSLLMPAVLGIVGVRMLAAPLGMAVRLAGRGLCGFFCLWLLNLASGVTGITIPINAVTVLVSGILGLPGIGLLALLEVL